MKPTENEKPDPRVTGKAASSKARAADPANPTQAMQDRHVLGMMLLLMKCTKVNNAPSYPIIDLVKNSTQAAAGNQYPIFNQVNPAVYIQVNKHLNAFVGNPSQAIQDHQVAIQNVATDAVGAQYTDDECPFWASIDTAVAALIP